MLNSPCLTDGVVSPRSHAPVIRDVFCMTSRSNGTEPMQKSNLEQRRKSRATPLAGATGLVRDHRKKCQRFLAS